MISLFDGIGALRVALDCLRVPVAGFVSVELDDHASRVVESYFPDVLRVTDVGLVDLEMMRELGAAFPVGVACPVGCGTPMPRSLGVERGPEGGYEGCEVLPFPAHPEDRTNGAAGFQVVPCAPFDRECRFHG